MKAYLFRWHRRTQLDIALRAGYLSLGIDRQSPPGARIPWRPIAYYSPDATPAHPASRGLKGWGS